MGLFIETNYGKAHSNPTVCNIRPQTPTLHNIHIHPRIDSYSVSFFTNRNQTSWNEVSNYQKSAPRNRYTWIFNHSQLTDFQLHRDYNQISLHEQITCTFDPSKHGSRHALLIKGSESTSTERVPFEKAQKIPNCPGHAQNQNKSSHISANMPSNLARFEGIRWDSIGLPTASKSNLYVFELHFHSFRGHGAFAFIPLHVFFFSFVWCWDIFLIIFAGRPSPCQTWSYGQNSKPHMRSVAK